ncbi:MAG: hypothetical protein E6R14_04895, partial [Thermomicrobiales bacterium]
DVQLRFEESPDGKQFSLIETETMVVGFTGPVKHIRHHGDIVGMKESLEVRVPMLDEDLFAFGLTLPHRLKVSGRTCKLVLRGVADRRLPPAVARKPKWGFSIPIDTWVDASFKARVRETLLGRESRLPDVFRPEAYRPIIEAFCSGQLHPDISRQGLHQRVVMLLSVHLALSNKSHPTTLD